MERLDVSSPLGDRQETNASRFHVHHRAAATLVVGRTESKNNNLFLIYLFLLYISNSFIQQRVPCTDNSVLKSTATYGRLFRNFSSYFACNSPVKAPAPRGDFTFRYESKIFRIPTEKLGLYDLMRNSALAWSPTQGERNKINSAHLHVKLLASSYLKVAPCTI